MSSMLLKPSIAEVRALGPYASRVTVEPLERGFGHTLGNAMRRVMMSSIPGFAATEVKIDGIMHEYDRVEGMREEVVWLMLNLKNVIFKLNDSNREVLRVKKEGPGTVVAGDIQLTHNVEVINPDCPLATLVEGGSLAMEIVVESGAGYQPAAVMEKESRRVGVIHLDASFCPVRRMSFSVASARHESRVDMDRLIMEIESNGIFSCEELVRHSSRILIGQLSVFAEMDDEHGGASLQDVGRRREAAHHPMFAEKVDALSLTVRSQNCLRQENIRYIGELVQKSRKEMLRTPNLGKKSLVEIEQSLGAHGLEFGMDLPGWRIPR